MNEPYHIPVLLEESIEGLAIKESGIYVKKYIDLIHKNSNASTPIPDDKLNNLLDMAEFDGGNDTYGKLIDGDIIDFNIITNKKIVESKVEIISQPSTHDQSDQQLNLQPTLKSITISSTSNLVFIFNVKGDANVQINSHDKKLVHSLLLGQGELFQWRSYVNKSLVINGHNLIIIQLKIDSDKIK